MGRVDGRVGAEGGMAERGLELPADLAAAVGEHLGGFVQDQVRSGRYRDAADVVRAALYLLESQGLPGGLPSEAEIRAMVEEGDASGIVDEDPGVFFDQLRTKLIDMPPGEQEQGSG